MLIEPAYANAKTDETFEVNLVVSASIPVNAFAGEVRFDPDYMTVASIDYNNSIADLWTTVPWYQNGDGTINFAGGTTVPGGFTGKGSLITITFLSKKPGVSTVLISGAQILKHDGYGSDTSVALAKDTLFTVIEDAGAIPETTIINPTTQVVVGKTANALDLNRDGKQSIADVSIFMHHLLTQNTTSDFNQDNKVNLADLSILMDGR